MSKKFASTAERHAWTKDVCRSKRERSLVILRLLFLGQVEMYHSCQADNIIRGQEVSPKGDNAELFTLKRTSPPLPSCRPNLYGPNLYGPNLYRYARPSSLFVGGAMNCNLFICIGPYNFRDLEQRVQKRSRWQIRAVDAARWAPTNFPPLG